MEKVEALTYLYGTKIWEQPRNGIFRCDINVYDPNLGWLDEEKELHIIGETDTTYFDILIKSDVSYPTPDFAPVKGNFIYGIGPHKERLVKWIDTQLTLF